MRYLRWLMIGALALTLGACGDDEGTGGDTADPSPAASAETPSAIPEPDPVEAHIIDLINDVNAHAQPDEDWTEAVVDMMIFNGGEVWAQEASTARVGVEDSLVRVAPNTIFTLGQPEPEMLELNLEEGQIWIEVEGLAPGETFEVETPSATALVLGTAFSARVAGDGTATFSVRSGEVDVTAAGITVTVTAGHETTVLPGEAPQNPVPMSAEEQLLWGMAAGPHLGTVLPVLGDVGVMSYTGTILSRDWSPDGQTFALSYSDSEGDARGLLFDVESSTSVTSVLAWETVGSFFNPADPGLFAYQSIDGPDAYFLCTARLDGTLDDCFGGDAAYGWPMWSPDGEWLLFYSNRDGGFHLYRARADGSEMSRLTTESNNNIRQSWSPQADQIAFVRASLYGGPGDVWVMDADGGNQRLLFSNVYGSGFDHLDWNPEGTALAVPVHGGGLYVVPVDGSNPMAIPGADDLQCRHPVWSPTDDGWPLVFYGYDAANDERGMWYVPDGDTAPQPLFGADWGPNWSPDGMQLVVGVTDTSGAELSTWVYFFETEPGFWR